MEEKKIYIGFKLLFQKWRFFISFLLKKKSSFLFSWFVQNSSQTSTMVHISKMRDLSIYGGWSGGFIPKLYMV